MAEIFDDGLKEYVFKNKFDEVFAKFRFNPTDTGIIKRYEQIAEFFNKTVFVEGKTEEETANQIVLLDEAIKEQFNILCGRNVSDGLFGMYTPLTLFANGDFYAEVALTQIVKYIEKELDVRLDKKKAKIRKDIAKNRA